MHKFIIIFTFLVALTAQGNISPLERTCVDLSIEMVTALTNPDSKEIRRAKLIGSIRQKKTGIKRKEDFYVTFISPAYMESFADFANSFEKLEIKSTDKVNELKNKLFIGLLKAYKKDDQLGFNACMKFAKTLKSECGSNQSKVGYPKCVQKVLSQNDTFYKTAITKYSVLSNLKKCDQLDETILNHIKNKKYRDTKKVFSEKRKLDCDVLDFYGSIMMSFANGGPLDTTQMEFVKLLLEKKSLKSFVRYGPLLEAAIMSKNNSFLREILKTKQIKVSSSEKNSLIIIAKRKNIKAVNMLKRYL